MADLSLYYQVTWVLFFGDSRRYFQLHVYRAWSPVADRNLTGDNVTLADGESRYTGQLVENRSYDSAVGNTWGTVITLRDSISRVHHIVPAPEP